MRSATSKSWARSAILLATLVVFVQGCMQSEIPGTYDVAIEIARSSSSIQGTLIISKAMLDVPSPTQDDRAMLGDWIQGDASDANSCFILHAGPSDESPKSVRFFDVRIRGNEITLPLEIYRTPVQSLEIVDLDFFANAIGGEIVLQDQGETRPGRISGSRIGHAQRQRCLDDLEIFRETLRNAIPQ